MKKKENKAKKRILEERKKITSKEGKRRNERKERY